MTVNTDSDGRAVAVLTLGLKAGIENNRVEAVTPFAIGLPAAFTASSVEPGEIADTAVSGVVLDNSNVPIEGATLRILGTIIQTQSDKEGQFNLIGVNYSPLSIQKNRVYLVD